MKFNLIESFFDGEPAFPLNIGDSLIQPLIIFDRIFDRSNFKLGFSRELKSLSDKAVAEQRHIKASIRYETLKKLHRDIGKNLDDECEEEGFNPVSDIAKENVKQILNAVYNKFPDFEYHIYPTADREIAFDCNPQKGKGVLILCDSKGEVAYFSTFAGRNSSFRCDRIADFPYENLWKIFKQLDRKGISIPDLQGHPVSIVQKKSEMATNSNSKILEESGSFAAPYKYA